MILLPSSASSCIFLPCANEIVIPSLVTTGIGYIRGRFQHCSMSTISRNRASIDGKKLGDDHRIHILGVGNIGKLIAHALVNKEPAAQVTLLLHRSGLLDDWEAAGQTLDIITNGVSNKNGHYDVELVTDSSQNTSIQKIIVATKAARAVSALQQVKHRLSAQSTILFAQNGMGTTEEIEEKVFPESGTRPHFLSSVISHGIYTTGPFSSVHAGQGYVVVGPAASSPRIDDGSQRFIDEVVSSTLLNSRQVASTELLFIQLEKLTVNAMMNPLTVIFDCQNGDLFTREPILSLMRGLLDEVSNVYQHLPELIGKPEFSERFGNKPLEAIVLDMAKKTAANTSSMLQDVRAGRETEIDYINGYIVRRGQEVGILCPMNQQLIQMVKKKTVITPEQIWDWFPKS